MVTELGTRADADTDTIAIDGKPIELGQEKLYVLLNKPPGYTSTRFDRFAEHTVMELVSELQGYLYPVGRLDVDTSGAILLTNDGDLANLLTHPSHEVDKTYLAIVRGRIDAAALAKLERGVELDDGPTAPAKARLISYAGGRDAGGRGSGGRGSCRAESDTSKVELTIHEGRKRQVKRMFQAVGHRVEKLTRTRFGSLDLKGLSEGEHRYLTKKEIAKLRKLANAE